MKIIVFTGAGMSKESGLDTFRKGGLWDGYNVRDVAYADKWYGGDNESKKKILDFYNKRRHEVKAAEPNDGHKALVELEFHHDVTVITQNIDDLHERAGSSNVIHLHGEIMKGRSVKQPRSADNPELCDWTEDMELGQLAPDNLQVRPHVVWFGEGLPMLTEAFQKALADDVDVLIVCGTTLEVGPANVCALSSKAKTIYIVDPNPPNFMEMTKSQALWGGDSRAPVVEPTVFIEGAVSGIRKVVDLLIPKEIDANKNSISE